MKKEPTPAKNPFKIAVKILLVLFISILALIGTVVLLLFVYENDVKNAIVGELNKNLNAEVKINPENINLTIIKTFPDCALQFNDVLILEALPIKKRDTLLFAGQLNLHFNVMDIYHKKYDIQKIKIRDGYANLLVLKNGKNNYTFWKSNNKTESKDSVKFNLKLVSIDNCLLRYKDKQQLFKTELKIKTLTFKGNFEEEKYDIESKADLEIKYITQNKTSFLKEKNLSYKINLNVNHNEYKLNNAYLNLNKMTLDLNGSFLYKDSLQNLNIQFNAPNLDIQSALSLLPEVYKSRISDYESAGNFYAKGKLKYINKNNYQFSSLFGIKNGEITYQPKSTKATDVNIVGDMQLQPNATALNINAFSLKLNNDELNGNLVLTDFENAQIKCQVKANFNLNNLQNFWPIDTVTSVQGNLKLNLEAEGLVSDFQKQIISDKTHLSADLGITALELQLKEDDKLYKVESASVTVREQDIEVQDLQLKRGQSDLKLNGKLPRLISAITNTNQALIIEGNLFSNRILLEDFLPKKASGGSNENPLIPDNIQFKLNAAILNFSFGKFEAKNITGEMDCKKQKLFANDIKFETSGGEVELNVFADNSKNKLDVVMQSNFKDLDINTLFTQFNNFGQTTLIDKNIKGIANATIDFAGTWNNKLEVNEKSIVTTCKLNIDRGELIDFKPLLSLANYVDVAELKRIKFSTLESKIDIKDRIITIPETSIINSALNINFWGTHTFDYDIDYHIQLLISDYLSKKRKRNDDEFGPIENDASNKRSAFILMTGKIDNPVIKYDKKGLKQKIKNDIKIEKQTVRQIFKEEFGVIKRDSIKVQKQKKAEQVFELEPSQKKKPQRSNNSSDDDDF